MPEPTMFEQMGEQLQAVRAQMREHGEVAMKNFFKTYFEDYPNLQGVRWPQYTPGFNDGDPCVFSIGEISFLLPEIEEPKYGWANGHEGWCESYHLHGDHKSYDINPYIDVVPDDVIVKEYQTWNGYGEDRKQITKWSVTYDVHPMLAPMQQLATTLYANAEVLEQAFGNNVEIIVTRDEITIEDYDCGY